MLPILSYQIVYQPSLASLETVLTAGAVFPLVAAPAFQSLGLNCLYHITAAFQKVIRVNMSHVVVITFITWPEVFLKVLFSG